MKKYKKIFTLFLVCLFAVAIYGCGSDNDAINTSGVLTFEILPDSNIAVGDRIEFKVKTDDPDDLNASSFISSWEIISGEVVIARGREGAGLTVETDPNFPLSLFITAWEAGDYGINGFVNDGVNGQSPFSEMFSVEELYVNISFLDGGYAANSFLEVSSNGDNMTYDIWMAESHGQMIQKWINSTANSYDLDKVESLIPMTFQVIGYNTAPNGERFSPTSPSLKTITTQSHNRAPIITDSAPDPNSTVYTGQEFVISVSAYDPDGDPLVYVWSASDPNVVEFTDPNVAETTAIASKAGRHTLIATVSDGALTATATIPLIAVTPVEPQIQDPNSLYEDANKIASTHITLHKKTGEIEVDIRPLLTPEGQAAFDAGGEVFLWGTLNSWNPTEEFRCDIIENKVLIDIFALNLERGQNYGVSFVVIHQSNFFWQDLQMEVDDLLLMGEDTSGGSVLVFRLNADGTLDNLPTGTVVAH